MVPAVAVKAEDPGQGPHQCVNFSSVVAHGQERDSSELVVLLLLLIAQLWQGERSSSSQDMVSRERRNKNLDQAVTPYKMTATPRISNDYLSSR